MVFGAVLSEGHILPPHIIEVGLKVYLDVLKSLVIPGAIWWPVADLGCGNRNRRPPTSPKRPRLGFRRSATTLYPSHIGPLLPDLNPLDYFVWSYVENITNMTSHNTKASLIAAIRRVFVELRLRLWKSHAPSSGSVARRWLRLKVATLNRYHLYYIIKLPKLSCSDVFFRTTILSFHPVQFCLTYFFWQYLSLSCLDLNSSKQKITVPSQNNASGQKLSYPFWGSLWQCLKIFCRLFWKWSRLLDNSLR